MIDISLVGYGYWGEKVARNLARHPQFRLDHICDVSEERLKIASENFPGIALGNDFDLLKTKAVALVTPISCHAEMALKILETADYLMVAKPLCTDLDQLKTIEEIVSRFDKTVLIDQTFIYSPVIQMLKKTGLGGKPEEESIIDIERLNCGTNCIDTHILWDLFCHDLSILYYAFGLNFRSCRLESKKLNKLGHMEEVRLVLSTSSKTINVHLAWNSPEKVRRISWTTPKGRITYDEALPQKLESNYLDFSRSEYFFSDEEPLYLMVEDFHRAIQLGIEPQSSLKLTRKIAESISRIEKLEEGSTLNF
jgi:predicted dehydrogenase